MKILLISDSHGKKEYIEQLVQCNNYQYIFFAGDGIRDLGVDIYDPKFVYVRGNCDFFAINEPITQTIFVDNLKILITHGDYYNVKYGLEKLQLFAIKNNYNLICFGHTHKKMFLEQDGKIFINAGSLKNGDFAEIKIENGKVSAEFKNIEEII